MIHSPYITVFAGLFGSGKTNLAANYAMHLKRRGEEVVLLDMDVVNPLFRMSELSALLAEKGIAVITPSYAGTNIDIPALPCTMEGILQDAGKRRIVIDLGGDDIGATALGRYAGVVDSAGYEMLYVYNCYRPFAQTAQEAHLGMMEIERAARLTFTHIAANPNLGEETTRETVLFAKRQTEALSRLSGLEVAFTAVMEGIPVSAEEVASSLFPIQILLNRAGALRPTG